jgi:hypothetical protein
MTGSEDPLADAAALRLVSRAPKAAELATLTVSGDENAQCHQRQAYQE